MFFDAKLALIVSCLAYLASGHPLFSNWKQLNAAERQGVLKEVTPLVTGEVGPIYISFGSEALRNSKNESFLFDAYSLHVPGNRLPYVLLSSARSSNPLEGPPPFQTPPLRNVVSFNRAVLDRTAHNEPAPAFPSGQDFYKGVPVLNPAALGKISIKSSITKKLRFDKGGPAVTNTAGRMSCIRR